MAKGTICPVMPGEQAKEKFYVNYQGRRIHLCCRNCVKAFKRNPTGYLSEHEAEVNEGISKGG